MLPTFADTNVLKILELSMSPALPKVGDGVTVTLRIQNESSAALPKIEWKLSGATSKTGSVSSVAAHSSVLVTRTFTAQSGGIHLTAQIDPANKIPEPPPLRLNNSVTLDATTSSVDSDWGTWTRSATSRTRNLINELKSRTTVAGRIDASTLTVQKLNLGSVNTSAMKQTLTGVGLPDDVAQAFVNALVKVYKDWAGNYRAIVPYAYPAFVAWPAASAGPMPNVAFPLVIGGSASSSSISPSAIESALRSKLSAARKAEPGAAAAISEVSIVLSGQLLAWFVEQQAKDIVGKGPVPAYAPPQVVVGQVLNGTIAPALTHLP